MNILRDISCTKMFFMKIFFRGVRPCIGLVCGDKKKGESED